MESQRPLDPAHRAAARAAARGGYMAAVLAAYQELEHMDEQQLADALSCSRDALPLLGLCREPRRTPPRFAADVRELATFAGANVERLAALIRAVDGAHALARRPVPLADGFLAAARDAADATPDPAEPPDATESEADDGSGS